METVSTYRAATSAAATEAATGAAPGTAPTFGWSCRHMKEKTGGGDAEEVLSLLLIGLKHHQILCLSGTNPPE